MSPSGKRLKPSWSRVVANRNQLWSLAGIARAVQFRPGRAFDSADIMPGRHRLGAEVAGEAEQVGELDTLVAADAGDRCLTARVAVSEVVDHGGAEAFLGVDDVVRDAEPVGHVAGVGDVAPGAAGRPCDPQRRHGHTAAA